MMAMEHTYQNLDLAMTSLGAKTLMAMISDSGAFSVGTLLPVTKYWWTYERIKIMVARGVGTFILRVGSDLTIFCACESNMINIF